MSGSYPVFAAAQQAPRASPPQQTRPNRRRRRRRRRRSARPRGPPAQSRRRHVAQLGGHGLDDLADRLGARERSHVLRLHVELLLHVAQDLDALDRVDAQLRLKSHVHLDHVRLVPVRRKHSKHHARRLLSRPLTAAAAAAAVLRGCGCGATGAAHVAQLGDHGLDDLADRLGAREQHVHRLHVELLLRVAQDLDALIESTPSSVSTMSISIMSGSYPVFAASTANTTRVASSATRPNRRRRRRRRRRSARLCQAAGAEPPRVAQLGDHGLDDLADRLGARERNHVRLHVEPFCRRSGSRR